jgi:hypothetical protein
MQTLQHFQLESNYVDLDKKWESIGFDQMIKSRCLDGFLLFVFDDIGQLPGPIC